MRQAGQAKAGFYPTPPEVSALIASWLRTPPHVHVHALDPCCGTGDALSVLQKSLKLVTHGIELNRKRASEARAVLNQVVSADAFRVHWEGHYGLLFLNPPYDQSDGERLELRFLWHTQSALRAQGVLVFIVPEPYLPRYAETLARRYHAITIKRFPDASYKSYKQVVVFAQKRAYPKGDASLPAVSGALTRGTGQYTLPPSFTDPSLSVFSFDPDELAREVPRHGSWPRVWDAITPPDPQAFRPLLPLRRGHLALLMAAGLLNNTVIEGNGRRLLVRGRVNKTTHVSEDEDEQGVTITEREVLKTEVTALDLTSGELIEIA